MGFAIIRNAKYKMGNLNGISRHNERQNQNYGNKDIDPEKSHLNFHLKKPMESSYEKEFYRLQEENNLKGNLRLTGKKQSNVACEFLITSSNDYFNKIGFEETKRYFESAYDFAIKKCGEKNIISAVVHLDEKTPHMHLTYIPTVKEIKNGLETERINCSKFWQGFNSYGKLQDDFHAFMIERGFELERGIPSDKKHIEINEFKAKTLDEKVKTLDKEKNNLMNDLKAIREDLKKYTSITMDINDINRLEGKEGFLSRNKIVLDKDDFEFLKNIAKKQLVLENEFKSLIKENKDLKDYVNKFEKYYDDNHKEKVSLHKEIRLLKKEVELENNKLDVFKEFIKKENLVGDLKIFLDERNKKILEQQKDKSWEMEL